jgi:hypothetical protein
LELPFDLTNDWKVPEKLALNSLVRVSVLKRVMFRVSLILGSEVFARVCLILRFGRRNADLVLERAETHRCDIPFEVLLMQ